MEPIGNGDGGIAAAAEVGDGSERRQLFDRLSFNVVRRGTRRARLRRASLETLSFPVFTMPTVPRTREIDLSKVSFLFNKQLKNSDVGALRRMVLPKKEAETHLPRLDTKEGISIRMLDMDGVHEWLFKYSREYRYWPNNSSRMYVLESTGEFAMEHDLLPGDYVLLYRNIEDGRYIIEGRKKEDHEARTEIYNNGHVTNEVKIDLNVTPSDDMDILYEYEEAYMDDFLLEYVGEPIILPSLASRSFVFEPIENYSAEDFQFQMI